LSDERRKLGVISCVYFVFVLRTYFKVKCFFKKIYKDRFKLRFK